MKTWVANLQSSITESVGGWMPLINMLGMGSMAITGMISLGGQLLPLLGNLSKSTKLMAAAQWLLNIALSMNPIGLVVIAVTALIGIVIVAINTFDQWGAALLLFLCPVGIVINAFKSIYDHWAEH